MKTLIFIILYCLLIMPVLALCFIARESRVSNPFSVAGAAVKRCLALKRMCARCKPMRYLGGNPFARQTTHGMCRRCCENVRAEIELANAKPADHKAAILILN